MHSLGADRAAFVGLGLGAWLTWSMPTLRPDVSAAIAAVGAPHPAVFHRAVRRHPLQWRSNGHRRGMQAPFAPGRQPMTVARRLRTWSGPDHEWLTPQVVARYAEAMPLPFAGRAAAEYHRRRHTSGPLQVSEIRGVGHFVPEEAPEQMDSLLIDWLDAVHPAR